MVRYQYVEQLVYDLYNDMPEIHFPLKPESVVDMLPNCGCLSYQRFGFLSRRSTQEVIDMCESPAGCTYYDKRTCRYLILVNKDVFANNAGRRRWTFSHEIGHVLCGHFQMNCAKCGVENGILTIQDQELEREADYFAATLLAPLPLFSVFDIRIADDVAKIFGLSKEASRNRINEYTRWRNEPRNPVWDHDMKQLFYDKSSLITRPA